jgi:hypothetical protein
VNVRRPTLLVAVLFAACALRPAPLDLEPGTTVAVAPVENRTGEDLLVSGASFIDRYALHAERLTVGDVLASEAGARLKERGLRVANGDAARSAPTLEIAILRWEPDAPVHTSFVLVALSAELVDPKNGKVLWRFDRPTSPVATPGEVTLESAYETAARKVMDDIFGAK